jgi:hypothetical protein
VRLTASLSRPSLTPVTVHYATADGSATAGSDYTSKSGTITFAAGATSAAVSISVKGDRVPEGNEAFTVVLSSPQGATLHRTKGTVSVLTDDRSGSPTTGVQLSVGAASVVEGNVGARALRFTVALSTPSTTAVQLHYATTPGTATASDFSAASGNVTIPAGATTAVVSVRVKADTVAESTEQFTLTLSAPVGATIDRATALGSILDDD